MTGYFDCSKFYERVRHKEAHQRAMQAGCPITIANRIFNQYCGYRTIRVHGADGGKVQASAGLVAGCAFAKDVLKNFLVKRRKVRDYLDDITVT